MAVTFIDNVVRVTSDAAEQLIVIADPTQGGLPQLRVVGIRWVVASATSGDNCQIKNNASGTVIWESVATATAPYVDETVFDASFELRAANGGAGLSAVVDSGTLYLYLGRGLGFC